MKPLVSALACFALAGCLGNGTRTVDVAMPQSAYNMLYGADVSRSAVAPATAPVVAAPVQAPAPTPVAARNAPVVLTVPDAAPAPAPTPVRAAPVRQAPAPAPAPAPQPAPVAAPEPAPAPVDTCGAGGLQGLVGGPVQAALDMNLPSLTRFYGANEPIDPRQTPARVNVVVSTANPAEALTTGGTVTRVFCG